MKTDLIVLPDGPRPAMTIGGTDAGALLNVNPYRSPAHVYDILTGVLPAIRDTPLMARGRALEGVCRTLLRETGDYILVREGCGLADPALPRVHATVDGVVRSTRRGGLGVLECKVVQPDGFAQIRDEGMHPWYGAQLQHYLWVTGAPWGVFAVLEPARWEFQYYEVERDEALLARLAEAVEVFCRDHVDAGVRPTRRRYGVPRRAPLAAPGGVLSAAITQYAAAEAAVLLAQTARDHAREALLAARATERSR